MTFAALRTALFVAVCAMLSACATSKVRGVDQTDIAREPQRYIVVTLRNPAGPSLARAGSTMRDYDTVKQYSAAPATRALANAVASAHSLRAVTSWPIAILDLHCLIFELPAGVDQSTMLDALRRDRRVESAQPLQTFDVLSEASDPYRKLQRNLDAMRVTEAHAWSRGEGVRVAVIDTGVDDRHPDLVGRIVEQRNFVEGSAAIADVRHGTAVAGVIAAVENNEEGIVGIAPASRLHAFRACWSQTSGSAAVCNTLTLAKALVAAIDARADIVNLSLSGPSDPLLSRLVAAGLRRGMVFVGALPPEARGASFPADIAGTLKVAAAGSNDAQAALLAPGTDVLTLTPDGRYDFLSGNSLATANVAGGVALLMALDRKLQAAQVQALLAHSMLGNPASSIDVCAAMALLPLKAACTSSSGALRATERAPVDQASADLPQASVMP